MSKSKFEFVDNIDNSIIMFSKNRAETLSNLMFTGKGKDSEVAKSRYSQKLEVVIRELILEWEKSKAISVQQLRSEVMQLNTESLESLYNDISTEIIRRNNETSGQDKK